MMSAILLVCLLCDLLLFALLKKQKRKSLQPHKPKLPPGSMGLPYIGETFQLYSQSPGVFFATKEERYGEIFKSHILGYPCIMLANPTAIRFVLVGQAHLFKPIYPRSKQQLIGPWALFFHDGDYHTRIRKLVQGSMSFDIIRTLVPDIEYIVVSTLDSWCNEQVINTFHELKRLALEVAVLLIFGDLDASYKEELIKNYCLLDKGYNCFPFTMPGTSYSKSLRARKSLKRILGEIINQRKGTKLPKKDLLGALLNREDDKARALSDDQIADNILGVFFAAQDTTASLLTWMLKYMHDHPNLLDAITEEQQAIYEANERGKRSLTWAQTRNMPVTNKFVMESMRMASVVSFTFREAVEDIEYKGFLIPKGWKVLPLFRNLHHNPELFPDPEKFDPSRFEAAPRPNTFMPFGNGAHTCPGSELAKLEVFIFIYHLVNKFKWEIVGSSRGVECNPFPVPERGLPCKFGKKTNNYGHEMDIGARHL